MASTLPTILHIACLTFQSFLPPRKDLADFTLPPSDTPNPTRSCFARGSNENMPCILQACHDHQATVTGAFIAAMHVAYLKAAIKNKQLIPDVMRLNHHMMYNMRGDRGNIFFCLRVGN